MNDADYQRDFGYDADITDSLEQDSYEGLDFYAVNTNIDRFWHSARHAFCWDTFQVDLSSILIICLKWFCYRSESSYLDRKPLIIVHALGELWRQRGSDLQYLYNLKYSDTYHPIQDSVGLECFLLNFVYSEEGGQKGDEVEYNGEKLFFKAMSTVCDAIITKQDTKIRLIMMWFIVSHLSDFVVNYYENLFANKFYLETFYFAHLNAILMI